MNNAQLKQIANRIREDWQQKRDEREIEEYAQRFGYCTATAEQFMFDLYLEDFSDRGKINSWFYGLVDGACIECGIDNELTESDYQLVWGLLNRDIELEIEKNMHLDAVGLAMIK